MPETRVCSACGSDVTRPPSRFTGERAFCDKECMAEGYDERPVVECVECGDSFKRTRTQVEAYDTHYCSNDCMYENFDGEDSFNWDGGHDNWSTSPEASEWRESVFERDNYTCQDCGQVGGRLNAHHIKRKSEYPELKTDVENGTTLCLRCHAERHEGESCHDLLLSNIRRFG